MMGMPPPGMSVPPPMGPPMGMPNNMPAMVPPYSAAALGMDEEEIMKKLDPGIVAKANEWTEHQSPMGQPYYYNSKTSDSVWEKPPAVRDFEGQSVCLRALALKRCLSVTHFGISQLRRWLRSMRLR